MMSVVFSPIKFKGRNAPNRLLEHLARVDQARAFATLGTKDAFGFVAELEGAVIGHISLVEQDVELPDPGDLPLFESAATSIGEVLDRALRESFVQSFAVEARHRRRGIGARLQRLAIEESRRRGLYQMRSWSSLDAVENYRLKVGLGFGVSPGHFFVRRCETWAAGCYFTMVLAGSD